MNPKQLQEEAKAKAADMGRTLAELDKLTGTTRGSLRADDAARKRAERAADRDLKIPRVVDPIRPRDCLADTYTFLSAYFPSVFYQAFTPTRKRMIDRIEHATRYGGDQAIAGPRG